MTASSKYNSIKPLLSIILFAIIFIVIFVLVMKPLESMFVALKMEPNQVSQGIYTLSSSVGLYIKSLFCVCILITAAWLCLNYFDKEKLSSIGIVFNKNLLYHLLYGSLIGFVLISLVFLIEFTLGWINVTGLATNSQTLSSILILTSVYSVKCINASLIEEICNRGYLFTKLEKMVGVKISVIVTSLVFAFLHIPAMINSPMTALQMSIGLITLFLFGVMLSLAFLLTRQLWIPVGLHFAWNFFEYFAYGLNDMNERAAILLITKVTGPKLWIGLPSSDFGPEAGLLGLVAAVSGIIVLFHILMHKRKVIIKRQYTYATEISNDLQKID